MFFHEISQELQSYLFPGTKTSDFPVYLIDEILRTPMNEEEVQLKIDGNYNPLVFPELSLNMLYNIQKGRNYISKERASKIYIRYDGSNLADIIDDLFTEQKIHLINFLAKKNIIITNEADLGSAISNIMSQIFSGLSNGIHDVDIKLTINEPKPSIHSLIQNRIYFENGALCIDNDKIELPIKLDESTIYEFESKYISALCEAYSDSLNKEKITVDEIDSLPQKYYQNFLNQRKAYLSAESIQRSIREVYEEGENQFNILKDDIFEGIQTTYYDDFDNGYKRLVAVLNKSSDIQLTKSKLMLIKNLIGNLERLGLIHILVNDNKIKSWVNPYEN